MSWLQFLFEEQTQARLLKEMQFCEELSQSSKRGSAGGSGGGSGGSAPAAAEAGSYPAARADRLSDDLRRIAAGPLPCPSLSEIRALVTGASAWK